MGDWLGGGLPWWGGDGGDLGGCCGCGTTLKKVNGEDWGILELMDDITIRQDCHTRTDNEDEHHPLNPAHSRPKIKVAPMVLML